MLDLSLAGLIGAIVGLVVAAANYAVLIGAVEKSLRAHDDSKTAEERDVFETKLAIMRRVVLAADIVVFAGLGYYLGTLIGG